MKLSKFARIVAYILAYPISGAVDFLLHSIALAIQRSFSLIKSDYRIQIGQTLQFQSTVQFHQYEI